MMVSVSGGDGGILGASTKKICHAQQFLGLGLGVCVNSLKKRKFVTKIFDSNIVE